MKLFPILILLLSYRASKATSHYVSTIGSNTNPGTAAKPWRTIQHACDSIAPLDTVFVSSGTYNERVTLRVPMTLAKQAGAAPIIDGTNLAIPDVDAALVLIKNLSHVTVSGFEIRNSRTNNSNLLPCGILVEGSGSGIKLDHNLIHNIENNGTDYPSINAFGIAVYGNALTGSLSDVNISFNTIRNTKTGNSETLTLNGNVNGFQVVGNLVHDVNNIGIDCIGFEGTSPIAGADQARNGIVSGNTVYNVTSQFNPAYSGSLGADGIYVDGGAHINIEGNTVHNTDIGIEVTSEHGGHFASLVTVTHNLISANNLVGISIGGYSASKGGTRNCMFEYNTLSRDDTSNSGTGEFAIAYNTLGNIFEHNVLAATGQGVFYGGVTGPGSTPGVTSDYNTFDATATPSWIWNGKTYTSLQNFQTGSGQDKHSG